MPTVPLVPRFTNYRGSKEHLRQKMAEHNDMAQRVVDHINALAANDGRQIQQYLYYRIAHDLNLSEDQVASAIWDGGHNGITIEVRYEERRQLARYKQHP